MARAARGSEQQEGGGGGDVVSLDSSAWGNLWPTQTLDCIDINICVPQLSKEQYGF